MLHPPCCYQTLNQQSYSRAVSGAIEQRPVAGRQDFKMAVDDWEQTYYFSKLENRMGRGKFLGDKKLVHV